MGTETTSRTSQIIHIISIIMIMTIIPSTTYLGYTMATVIGGFIIAGVNAIGAYIAQPTTYVTTN